MDTLVVQPLGIDVHPEFTSTLAQRLVAEGCDAGIVYLGAVHHMPDTGYILFHEVGDVPVSLMVPIENFHSANGIDQCCEAFLADWKLRYKRK